MPSPEPNCVAAVTVDCVAAGVAPDSVNGSLTTNVDAQRHVVLLVAAELEGGVSGQGHAHLGGGRGVDLAEGVLGDRGLVGAPREADRGLGLRRVFVWPDRDGPGARARGLLNGF